jgi:hypothetical protein
MVRIQMDVKENRRKVIEASRLEGLVELLHKRVAEDAPSC